MTKPPSARESESAAPRWAQSVWQVAAEASSRAGAPLSLQRIVAAAVEIADETGLAELSIRRIATRLSVSPMALYRHVDSRDDLVLLMVERALGAPPPATETPETWQDGVRTWAAAIFERYSTHRWIIDAPVGGLPATPNRALWLERLLQLLDRTGLDLQTTLDAALLIDTHLRGTAQLSRDLPRSMTDAPASSPWLAEVLSAERFPMLAQVLAASSFDDATEPGVQFGLERIISGLEEIVPQA